MSPSCPNPRRPRRAAFTACALPVVLYGCLSPEEHVALADAESYGILSSAAKAVMGTAKTFQINRPVDTLRQRLLTSQELTRLDLRDALDVAAENSRDYQTQRETLYRSALSLSQAQLNFKVRYSQDASAAVNGQDTRSQTLSFQNDLRASVNSEAGGRLVGGFASTFLENLLSGRNGLNGPQDILSLTLTQPLLAGFGRRIVREPLTQAERDVVYAMRSFERFRSGFTIRIVQDYYNILSVMENLKSVQANYDSLVKDRLRLVDLVKSGRNRAEDLDQARQSELNAESQVIQQKANLGRALDNFKITLGIPTATRLELNPEEFDRLAAVSLADIILEEENLVSYALARRIDYRTVRDQVIDAGRQIRITENALGSILDFQSAITVPNEASSKPFKLDWDRVDWSAGFDLNLALDRRNERIAYRRALIGFAAAIRDREEFEDQLRADIRDTLRELRRLEQAYKIESAGVVNAQRRVARTEMFMLAGGRANTQTRDVLEAKAALIRSQLALTSVLVDFAVAKLQLLRDIEALPLEPKGLRYDPNLPLPDAAQRPPEDSDIGAGAEENQR